jgi:biotin-(acetyl-CoA carboxylase) ligase
MSTHSLVVGVGLNITNDEPTVSVDTLLQEVASGEGIAEVPPATRGEVLAEMLNNFESFLEVRTWKYSEKQISEPQMLAKALLTWRAACCALQARLQ